MKVTSLENTPFEEIVECFIKAFENYFVSFPNDPEYFRHRWKTAGVRYDLSYGMFDSEKLVGFIIHAIDHRNGDLTAYNTGTGVLPEYRGRKIVQSIYDFALPDLRRNSITRCTLEVIRENDPAIKAYRRVGFKICKNYQCFRGKVEVSANIPSRLTEINFGMIDWQALVDQSTYSWDHHINSLKNGNYRYFIIGENTEPDAYFILNSETGYVAQFDCFSPANWPELFAAMNSISEILTIHNVEENLRGKIENVKKAGLQNIIDQYEMEMRI
ncbi:MAG: N-acetyltransferase [Salegentibacter sp.]